jgi:hypothetical protein
MKSVFLLVAIVLSLLCNAQNKPVPDKNKKPTVDSIPAPPNQTTKFLSVNDIEPFWKIISGRVPSYDGRTVLVLTKDEYELLRSVFEDVVDQAVKRYMAEKSKTK